MTGLVYLWNCLCTADPRNPNNYRGITLACATYNLYCAVLNCRFNDWTESNQVIVDEQNGFRSDRSCVDHLTALNLIIQTRKEKRKATFAAFIDFSKAFDRINRDYLWNKLGVIGLDDHMVAVLRSLYQNVTCCVRLRGGIT